MNNQTIIAFIRMLAPFAVSILAAIGVTMDADTVYQVLLILAGGAVAIYTGWKNNSITAAAQEADEYLHQLKAGTFDHDDARDME